jgi:hypothetical protein
MISMSNSDTRLCLADASYVPPGGFRCECPIVGGIVESTSLTELTDKCADRITDQGFTPPPDLYSLVQDAICSKNLAWKFCQPCKKLSNPVGAMAVIRWVKAMAKFAAKGFKLVEQEEAERRAEICAACPMQVETPSLCWGCHGIAGLLPKIVGARKTKLDGNLKTCGICGCYNSVSVHIPVDKSDLNYPEWCWKGTKGGCFNRTTSP